ncbi:MAG: hypothetical protein ACPKPY_05455 [Nitrososphaeraceae archaeon]
MPIHLRNERTSQPNTSNRDIECEYCKYLTLEISKVRYKGDDNSN